MIPSEYSGLAALARATRHDPVAVEVLPGDVGRRRYLRLTLPGGRTVLGVVYCAEEADSRRRWVAAHVILRERLRVPALIADDQAGSHIVEDLGRTDLATRLTGHAPERPIWLSRAAAAVAILAEMPDPGINPRFDAAFFRRELDLAREAVFDLFLDSPLSPGERSAHDAWADALSREIEAHPATLCHRDYHGNNLFPVGDSVGWIDFQDLRAGPDSYDLASLLWERTTLDWMTEALARPVIESFARARGLDVADFRARFDRVLLQRAWKVCGTFARAVAQGRGETYRRYLPAEIALVGRLLGNTPEDEEFRRLFRIRLAGVC
ncbi:MAG TPA: phosphotransferase [Thermoanaerobaculia bacterium]|nr:phosphotransferase [Thermoanaerobaculia bacterium]